MRKPLVGMLLERGGMVREVGQSRLLSAGGEA